MVLKKIASLFLALLVMCTGIMPVCAETTEPIVVTNETRTVTIDLETVQYEGTVIAIAAWYPGYSSADFGKYDIEKINAYTGEATVSADNRISKTFTLKANAPSGRYGVDIHVPGNSEPLTYTFDYRNVIAAAAVLETARTGSAAEIKAALDSSVNDVSVEAGTSYLTYTDEVRMYIADNIYNSRPQDEIALQAHLMEEIRVINTVKTVSQKTDDRKAMKTMLEAEPELFKISEYMTDYNKLTDEKREQLYTILSGTVGSCVFPEDVSSVFAEALEAVMLSEDSDDDSDDNYGSGSGGGGGSRGSTTTALRTEGNYAPLTESELKPEDPFTDISGHWAANPIKILTEAGVVNGKTKDSFCPDDTIKKEEFLKMVIAAFDCKAPSAAPLPFADVEYGSWYYNFVQTAYALGITKGISPTEFGIGTQISRQDMAVLLYNTCVDEGKTFGDKPVSFSDEGAISDYAKTAVSALAGGNIISGRDDGSFDPKATATRAEAVKMLYETLYKFGLL